MKPLNYFIANVNHLTPMEYRTLHRYYLTLDDRRLCSICKVIYDECKSHFHVKNYKNGVACYESRCKYCQSKQNLQRQLDYRADPKTYIKSKVTAYKARAKEMKLNFDLDAEYLYNVFIDQDQKCFYTNEPLSFLHVIEDRKSPHPLLASLDRKDPSLGYVKGNVVWCTYFINRMKNECTFESFIEYCKKILSIHG